MGFRAVSFRLRRLAIVVGAVAMLTAFAVPVNANASHPLPPKPLQVVTVHSPSGGRTYTLKIWAKTSVKNCRARAYGKPVRAFLATHRCYGLTRYLVTTKVEGRAVGFAESVVSFGTYATTGQFWQLIKKPGTGNFYSLFHNGYKLPHGPQSVPDPDAFNSQVQDVVVTSIDAWYIHGSTPVNARPLERMARDIYLQWF